MKNKDSLIYMKDNSYKGKNKGMEDIFGAMGIIMKVNISVEKDKERENM